MFPRRKKRPLQMAVAFIHAARFAGSVVAVDESTGTVLWKTYMGAG